MARLYYDQDADLGILDGKTIAVVGYGSQGRAAGNVQQGDGLSGDESHDHGEEPHEEERHDDEEGDRR